MLGRIVLSMDAFFTQTNNTHTTMNYQNAISRRHPRLVIFMIDQSALGHEDGLRGKYLAEIATEIVNVAITEMVKIATRPVGDDGEEEVRDFFHVCILGYGGEFISKVSFLYDGWISDLVTNFSYEVVNSFIGDSFNLLKILNPVVGYDCPLALAFDEAYKLIIEWGKHYNNEQDVSPLIINVTHGITFEQEPGNSKNEIIMQAQKIMDISFPDGPPLICNIITRKLEEDVDNLLDNTLVFEEGTITQLFSSISANFKDVSYYLTDDFMSQSHMKKLLLNVNDRYDHSFLSRLIRGPLQ